MKNRVHQNLAFQSFLFLLFAAYLAALCKILLFRSSASSAFVTAGSLRSVNLIPFRTIVEYTGIAAQKGIPGFLQFFANIFGNIIIFVPLGYFLPVFFRRMDKARRILLASAAFSTVIEILQFVLHAGSSDVDDVLLNTLGGLAGYLLLKRIAHRLPLRRGGYLAIVCLSFLLFSGGFAVAVTQYSAQVGLSAGQVHMMAEHILERTLSVNI